MSLVVSKYFLMFRGKFCILVHAHCLLSHDWGQSDQEDPGSIFFLPSLQEFIHINKTPTESSLLQVKEPHISHSKDSSDPTLSSQPFAEL